MPRNQRLASGLLICTLGALGGAAAVADIRDAPFTVDDLVLLKRISDPQLSPDGRQVAFVQRETDMDANKGRTSLWLLDLAPGTAAPRRLTNVKANDSSPRWSPDGRTLYFMSTRSGSSQVWRLALAGGDAQRVTDYPLEVGAFKVSARGDLLALSMEVFPDCPTLACTRERLDARSKDKATGRTYERLFIRHWDSWSNGTRSHLFSAPQSAGGAASATPVDVSKGFDADIPGKPFGGDEDFAFSPDGRSLVFSARIAGHTEPWSTNFDLFQTPVDGSAAPVNLTAGNPAWDAQPVFLANGDLAWLAQERPGFESDRFRRQQGPHQPVAAGSHARHGAATAPHGRQGKRLEPALVARRPHALLHVDALGELAGVAPGARRGRRAARHRLSARGGRVQGVCARGSARAVDGGVSRLPDPRLHPRAARRQVQGQGDRAHLRTALHPPLGQLEQRHAFASVQRAAECGRRCERDPGRRVEGLRCGHSRQTLRWR